MRACTTLPPGNEAAIRDTVQDLAISSQATRWVEGSSTIPRGSRVQADSKCAATTVVEDIVSALWKHRENEWMRLIRNITGLVCQ